VFTPAVILQRPEASVCSNGFLTDPRVLSEAVKFLGKGMFFSAIVFDFDGVIVESTDIKSAAFYEIGLHWGEDAARKLADYHAENFGVSRYTKFEWFFENVLGKELNAEESADLGRQFSSICMERIMQVPLVSGFTDAVAVAYGRCPLFVASAAPQEELETILAARGLDVFFKEIFGSPPEKTANLQRAVDTLNVNPGNVLMVGDSQADYQAAKSVGTDFYGRGEQFETSGYAWGEDLRNLVIYLTRKLA